MSRPDSSAMDPSPSSLLSERQRARLLKSSRKLAKVLGTTPLVELTPPSPGPMQATFGDARHTRSSRSMDVVRPEGHHSSIGRSSSFELSPAPAGKVMKHAESAPPTSTYPTRSWPPEDIELERRDAAKMPVYRYKVRRSRTASSIDLSSSPRGARSTNSFATLLSPVLSPSPSVATVDTLASAVPPADSAHRKKKKLRAKEKDVQDMEDRRRKMDKLVRHLGETPPTDLVFQPGQRSPRRRRAHLRKSRSLSTLAPSPAAASNASLRGSSTESLRAGTATAALQQNISVAISTVVVETQQHMERSSAESEAPLPPPKDCLEDNLAVLLPMHGNTVPAPPRRTHMRSRSHNPAAPRIASLFSRDSRFEDERQQQSFRENDDDDDSDEGPRMAGKLSKAAPQVQHLVVAHRSERRQGWSGEWNAESVQDVIEKLRNLK